MKIEIERISRRKFFEMAGVFNVAAALLPPEPPPEPPPVSPLFSLPLELILPLPRQKELYYYGQEFETKIKPILKLIWKSSKILQQIGC